MLLFNSLTHKKEKFLGGFSSNKAIKLYVCGITPYDTTHLGHAFTYIFFDVLVRYLQFKGYKVDYTQNVTDVNDRDKDILERAKEQNVPWQKLASFWTKQFLEDMQKLNWIAPNNYLFASEQIQPMIQVIESIIKNGFGYVVSGSVYLDISKIQDFGKLSRLTKEQMITRAREFEEDLNNPKKRNPLDITLWLASKPQQPPHIPSFESPFSPGRPGWHLECSAMAIASLGEQIDIHGGGSDLIFPHHESEIAQSEAATGKKPFSRFWLHTGTVMYKGEKMSKSLGNLVLISDLLKRYSPNAIRWVLLSHHWHKRWEFNEEELIEAEDKLRIIKQALNQPAQTNLPVKKLSDLSIMQFISIMDNNLDTPKTLDYIFLLAKQTSKEENYAQVIKTMLKTLGFKL